MQLSSIQISMIKERVGRHSTPVPVVSEKFGIPIKLIQAVVRGEVRPAPSIVDNDPDFLLNGPIHLRQYMIGRRSVQDGEWNYFQDITECREEYDLGRIELVTGRSRDFFFLYRIPRKVRDTKRRVYFAREFGEG